MGVVGRSVNQNNSALKLSSVPGAALRSMSEPAVSGYIYESMSQAASPLFSPQRRNTSPQLLPPERKDMLRPAAGGGAGQFIYQRSREFIVENPMRATSLKLAQDSNNPPDQFVRGPTNPRDAKHEESSGPGHSQKSVWTVQVKSQRTRIPAGLRSPVPHDGDAAGAAGGGVRASLDRNTDALLPPRPAAHPSSSNGGRPWSSGRAQAPGHAPANNAGPASALSARRGVHRILKVALCGGFI
jgi:hypothetical protein